MSLDKTKTDEKLGHEVEQFLITKNVQTPTTDNNIPTEDKLNIITSAMQASMEALGLNLKDDSLRETPKRIAKMYVNELFWGLDPKHFPKCTTVENKMHYDEMVLEKNITIKSVCEHHFLPFHSFATIGANVAYIPNKKVLGLSKLNRIVEYFSRRPQIQERLTEQIYFALQYILETDDIAVVLEAEHTCVKMRGVEDDSGKTVTSKLGGGFRKAELRSEFMRLIK